MGVKPLPLNPTHPLHSSVPDHGGVNAAAIKPMRLPTDNRVAGTATEPTKRLASRRRVGRIERERSLELLDIETVG